jgi:hypothetical protein
MIRPIRCSKLKQGARSARAAKGRCSACHLVAFVHLSRDAAKEWAARSALVERHVGVSQALLNYIHDLWHNIPNIRIL